MRRFITAVVDAIIGFLWRVFCRHEWKKDNLATELSSHTLIRNGMFAHGYCRKCGKKRLLAR